MTTLSTEEYISMGTVEPGASAFDCAAKAVSTWDADPGTPAANAFKMIGETGGCNYGRLPRAGAFEEGAAGDEDALYVIEDCVGEAFITADCSKEVLKVHMAFCRDQRQVQGRLSDLPPDRGEGGQVHQRGTHHRVGLRHFRPSHLESGADFTCGYSGSGIN